MIGLWAAARAPARTPRRLVATLVVLGACLTSSLLLAAPGAMSATACGALLVTPRPGDEPASFVLTAPISLSSTHLGDAAVSVEQGGPVPVRSFRPVDAARTDLAVVLDTSADVPDAVYRRARRVVMSLLEALPETVRTTVISSGGQAEILVPVGVGRDQAREAVGRVNRASGHAWLDGIIAAVGSLPEDRSRFLEVVVVTTGPDDASRNDPAEARSLLARRQVVLNVTDAGARTALPFLADTCPEAVHAGQGSTVGALVARRVSSRHVVVAPAVDLAAPVTVRLRTGAVDVSAVVAAPTGADGISEARGAGVEVDAAAGRGLSGAWVAVGLGLVVLILLGSEVAEWRREP